MSTVEKNEAYYLAKGKSLRGQVTKAKRVLDRCVSRRRYIGQAVVDWAIREHRKQELILDVFETEMAVMRMDSLSLIQRQPGYESYGAFT